jgi:hypothetical protein
LKDGCFRFCGRAIKSRKAVQVLHGLPSLSRITPEDDRGFGLSFCDDSVASACNGRRSDMTVSGVEGFCPGMKLSADLSGSSTLDSRDHDTGQSMGVIDE